MQPEQGRSSAAPSMPTTPRLQGLTNAQVIAMVKSGIDDATVIQAIRGASAVNFDLTPAGQKALTAGGVSRASARRDEDAGREKAARSLCTKG